jgi:leucyl aminopeptidase (aminopeptidase T)
MCVPLVACLGQMAGPSGAVDLGALAQRIVVQCGGVKEGEIVSVSGNIRDMALLEELVVEVRKAGAFPLLAVGSDALTRRMLVDVPEKYDSQLPRLDLKLAETVDAVIALESGSDPSMNADIPSQRWETRSRANAPVSDVYTKRGVRGIYFGNGMYPSTYRAAMFGMTEQALSKLFWDAVNVDYAKIQAIGESVQRQFAQGKEVRITNPNGTDITFRIGGQPVLVSDGVISADDVQRGFAASQVYLPAGEVFLAPVPGTARGKIVIDRMWFNGKEVDELALTFAAGKVTALTGKPGYEVVKARYDVAGPGKEDFAFIDVGINPNLKIPEGSRLLNWTAAGMVAIGIGGNTWAGGSNNCPYELTGYLPGSTLTIDGKALVSAGKLNAAGI